MAAKKKSKKQSKKKSSAKKARTLKVSPKKPAPKKPAKKKATAKKPVPKRPIKKKASERKPAVKAAGARIVGERKPPQKVRERREPLRPRFSGSQRESSLSGDADSQGLSEREGADSESVSELLEEGNAFEAGVVEGVERADDADEREVRTREFPEDDVPEEYLEKDE
jgi:hypothetical protein